MSSSPEDQARSAHYERGWALLYRLIRLNGSLSGHERNVLYWNRGDGTFADLSAVAGLDFPEDGRAFVSFDFDRDGDADILLNNRNSPQLRLLRNDLPSTHSSVAFRLVGTESNRDAVGARLVLETASGRQLVRSVRSGSGFRSQPSRTVLVGLGDEDRVRELRVHWPSGNASRYSEIPPGHLVEITEGRAGVVSVPFDPGPETAPAAPFSKESATGAGREGIWLTEATPAPVVRGRSLDGSKFEPGSYRGRRVLLNFWATWCLPCQGELADLRDQSAALEAAGVQTLLVSVDEPGELESVRRFVRERELQFAVVLPDEESVTAFDLLVRHILDQSGELAIPASFLIDESGRVLKLYLGRTSAAQVLSDFASWPDSEAELLERALPFPGRAYTTRFERNWVQLGDAYASAGLGREALAALEHAVGVHPKHAAILDRLGSLYGEQDRWRDAVASHRAAVELGLPGVSAQVHLAAALAELGRLSEARETAAAALAQAPADPDVLRVWGAVASRQGDFADALPALLGARESDPDNPETHYNLGWLYMQTGRAQEAAASLRRAVEIAPRHVRALHDLGILHARQGAWRLAADSLRKATEGKPDFPEAHYSLGLVHAQQGDFERAEASLRAALDLRGDYAEALADLGGVYVETRRFREALPLLARASGLKPELAQPYLNAVRAYLALGDRDSALARLEDLLQVRPDDPTALALRKRLGQ